MAADLKPRISRIQQALGLDADGIIGADTLTAIENLLFGSLKQPPADGVSLTVSRRGLEILVQHEIGSASYYKKKLSCPVFPGGASGVTIGIGYDLGYNSEKQIRADWGGKIPDAELDRLIVARGLKGESAKAVIKNLSDISISLETAENVFYCSTLPRFAKDTASAYPGTDQLFPDAQTALLSLVYNRGTKMSGSSRSEMKAIKDHVASRNYGAIAQEIKAMKRLWADTGLAGLLKRRDEEAQLILESDRTYLENELVRL